MICLKDITLQLNLIPATRVNLIKPANKFWLFAVLSVFFMLTVLLGIFLFTWNNLSVQQKIVLIDIAKENFEYCFAALFLVLGALGFGLDAIFNIYILPLNRLTEKTALIFSSNPSYRLKPEGGKDMMNLSEVINEGADRFEKLKKNIEIKIQNANADTEAEKNILAAIMAELPQGVLICNKSGRIILYNRRARQIFARTIHSDADRYASDQREKYIGLGRSIFHLIDKSLIVHAVEETQYRLRKNKDNIASHFIAPAGKETLYRFETVPILDKSKSMTGFILVFESISGEINRFKEINTISGTFSKASTAFLSEINTVYKKLEKTPDQCSEHFSLLQNSLHKNASVFMKKIKLLSSNFSEKMASKWPLITLPAGKLFETLQKKTGFKLGVRINVNNFDRTRVIQVEPYSFTTTFLFLIERLMSHVQSYEFNLNFSFHGRFLHLDLIWTGTHVGVSDLKKWENEQVVFEEDLLPFSLRDIIHLHNGEIQLSDLANNQDNALLRIILPTATGYSKKLIRKSPIISNSRPEFYDFNLFEKTAHKSRFLDTELSRLTYTVFDTETTGLNPDEGDEIISIGAVRIVNSRIQYEETFEQLINPRRKVPLASVKIHGINDKMLEGKPLIDTVLPEFHWFTEETILLGHNLAFDMKMIAMKEHSSGIQFTHPVLDTLLLSAVVHPLHNSHTMEKIAKRLGVNIMGRHTALGDSLATAEIFLRLLPLLRQKGIYKLKDAIDASKTTYLSRLKY